MNETATQAAPVNLSPPDHRGLHLRCPWCGSDEGDITLALGDGTFRCGQCDNTGTAEDVEELIRDFLRWRAAIAWVKAMPAME